MRLPLWVLQVAAALVPLVHRLRNTVVAYDGAVLAGDAPFEPSKAQPTEATVTAMPLLLVFGGTCYGGNATWLGRVA